MEKNTWLEFIRDLEISNIRNFLRTTKIKRILEIGGKNGFLAEILKNDGYEIDSVDINPEPGNFLVRKMNAERLEFKDEQFDLVFSSQVIAHIKNKNKVFCEINRVLKKDGIIIHLVPSTWWSILTNFWHYILLYKLISKNNISSSNMEKKIENDEKFKIKKLKNYLFLHPLGTEKSFIVEIFKFRKKVWKKFFEQHNYQIIKISNGPITYTGFGIFKNKGVNTRIKFSKFFPSSYVFYLKR